MNVLVVTVARFGNESNVLQLYTDRAAANGRREYPAGMPLAKLVEEIVLIAAQADFVCIDECALGAAVVDMLATAGVTNVLRSHRLRPIALREKTDG